MIRRGGGRTRRDGAQAIDNGLCDLVLDGEDVVHRPVVALGPELIPVRNVDQLRGDPYAIPDRSDAPLEHSRHVQLAPDALEVVVLALERKGRGTRRHLKLRHLGQGVQNLIRHAVREKLLFGIGAQVRKGQHCNGIAGLIGSPLLNGCDDERLLGPEPMQHPLDLRMIPRERLENLRCVVSGWIAHRFPDDPHKPRRHDGAAIEGFLELGQPDSGVAAARNRRHHLDVVVVPEVIRTRVDLGEQPLHAIRIAGQPQTQRFTGREPRVRAEEASRDAELFGRFLEPTRSPKEQAEDVVKVEIAGMPLDRRHQDPFGFFVAAEQPRAVTDLGVQDRRVGVESDTGFRRRQPFVEPLALEVHDAEEEVGQGLVGVEFGEIF